MEKERVISLALLFAYAIKMAIMGGSAADAIPMSALLGSAILLTWLPSKKEMASMQDQIDAQGKAVTELKQYVVSQKMQAATAPRAMNKVNF